MKEARRRAGSEGVELATRVGDDMMMFFRETPGWGSGGGDALEAGRDDAEGRIARDSGRGVFGVYSIITAASRRRGL